MIDSARRADAGWWLAGQDPLIGIAALSPANPANRTFRIVPAPARNPGVTRRRAAHGPQARADWFYAQRAYPLAEPPVGALQRARTQAEKIAEWSGRDKTSGSTPWTLVGPAGFDSRVEPSWGRMSGRVRALAIDPNNSNRLLAGTATGGAWLSSDAGASWTSVVSGEGTHAVGAVAFDPTDPSVFYVGTGEANGTYYSAGIVKAVANGSGSVTLGETVFSRGAIAAIVVLPTTPRTLVVCARNGKHLNGGGSTTDSVGGIYRSVDDGQSWVRTIGNYCTDLAAVPTDLATMYHSATGVGADNGLYKSTNAGVSWTRLSQAVGGEGLERLAIGLSNQGTRVWIGGKLGGQVVIQRSTDSGATFGEALLTDIPAGGVEDASYQLYCESQCDYDNAVAVNPFNANEVWLAGVGAFRSMDGGATFSQYGANNAGGGPLHVDHHLVLFDRRQQGVVYQGNDGGLYRSTDGGTTWASIGGTLPTIQSYHVSLHPTNAGILYTGNQDNGTTRRNGSNVWLELGGGDGGYSAVNHANPVIVYASTTELNLQKSLNSGDDRFQAAITQVPKAQGEPVAFIAPFVMDPVNPEVLYAGTNRVWRSADGAGSWAPVSDALTRSTDGVITHLAVARSDTSVIYTVASDGAIARSGPAGFALVQRAPLPNRYATWVAVHPTDPNIAYVGFSGFNDATPATPGHVFLTSNGGASWTDVSGNLPDTPVNSVAINPLAPTEVFVGTDVGVFISGNAGSNWSRASTNIPAAPITALAVNPTTNVLAAATYGRSVWVAELASTQPTGAQDEPSASRFPLPLPNPANANCPAGFFIATVADGPGEGLSPGIFGVELLLDAPGTRLLEGGLNFGGLVDTGQAGFAGFNFTNAANEPQRVTLSLTGNASSSTSDSFAVRVAIIRQTAAGNQTVFEANRSINNAQPFVASVDLTPGFYVATVTTAEGSVGGRAEGQFFLGMQTSFTNRPGGGFQGGAVVGGYHAQNNNGGVSGFAAFCLGSQHSTSIRVLSQPTYGPTGARDLRLRILDAQQRELVVVPGG